MPHPQQGDCNPDDPAQFAAWCWAAGIPDPSPNRPMPIPLISPMITEEISKMLWDFGFRHHPEFQKKWVSGIAGVGTLAQIVDEKPAVNSQTQVALQFLQETNPDLYERVTNATDITDLPEGDLGELGEKFAAFAAVIKDLQK